MITRGSCRPVGMGRQGWRRAGIRSEVRRNIERRAAKQAPASLRRRRHCHARRRPAHRARARNMRAERPESARSRGNLGVVTSLQQMRGPRASAKARLFLMWRRHARCCSPCRRARAPQHRRPAWRAKIGAQSATAHRPIIKPASSILERAGSGIQPAVI